MPAEAVAILSTLSSALALSVRVTEKIYEIVAVEKEARDLLETTSSVNRQLDHARKLRRQRSILLNNDEKKMIDDIFETTEKAVNTVAGLVEPARADMAVSGGLPSGRVNFDTRIVFVFRDSARIPVSLAKLNVAHGSLAIALNVLSSKNAPRDSWGGRASSSDRRHPPSYGESEWLHAQRLRNLRRRASALLSDARHPPAQPEQFADPINEDCDDTASINTAEAQMPPEDEVDVTNEARTEVNVNAEEDISRARPPIAVPLTRRLTARERNKAWLEHQSMRCGS